MSTGARITFVLGVLVLLGFLFVIALSDRGAFDLYQLRLERDRAVVANQQVRSENAVLYHTIKRLEEDPGFIENIARTEFGMTGQNEIVILKKKPLTGAHAVD
jgi:cell division protein FtsB